MGKPVSYREQQRCKKLTDFKDFEKPKKKETEKKWTKKNTSS